MDYDEWQPSPIAGVGSGWPTVKQRAAIGSVILVWSWIDLTFQSVLCRLAATDEFLGQALTEDLGNDQRIRAGRRLALTWKRLARHDLTTEHLLALDELTEILKWMTDNKAMRNKCAHWLWLRQDDQTLFGWKYHVMPKADGERPSVTLTTNDIARFAELSGAIADRLGRVETALRRLPAPPSLREMRQLPDPAN